jgi:hypothetical protein
VAGLFILKHMDGSNYRFLEQREAARDGKGHLERWIVALVRFFLGLCAGSPAPGSRGRGLSVEPDQAAEVVGQIGQAGF